jgi:tetratricopeptide (TPR) repeat protein
MSLSLNRHGNCLSARIEEVITYHRKALTLCPTGHPDRSMSLSILASAVLARCELLSTMEDLEEAITYLREALTLHPHGHADRSYSLNKLANAVLTQYEQSGRMEDLKEVITYHREALSHPDDTRSFHIPRQSR